MLGSHTNDLKAAFRSHLRRGDTNGLDLRQWEELLGGGLSLHHVAPIHLGVCPAPDLPLGQAYALLYHLHLSPYGPLRPGHHVQSTLRQLRPHGSVRGQLHPLQMHLESSAVLVRREHHKVPLVPDPANVLLHPGHVGYVVHALFRPSTSLRPLLLVAPPHHQRCLRGGRRRILTGGRRLRLSRLRGGGRGGIARRAAAGEPLGTRAADPGETVGRGAGWRLQGPRRRPRQALVSPAVVAYCAGDSAGGLGLRAK
mmetsp:Transcript_31914/g.69861  ORF Transcript_31914/g.69861 Transcript_31914/m.69861 type:complete len:255 (-) Transcript_31914:79-843(-)